MSKSLEAASHAVLFSPQVTFPNSEQRLKPLRPVSVKYQNKMGPTPPPVKQPSAVDLLKSTLPAWMLGTEPEPELEAQSHNPQHSFPLLEARPEQSAIAAPPSSRSLPRRSAVDELRKAIGLHNGNFLDDVKYVSQPPPTDLGNGELGRRKRPLDDDQDVMPKRRKTARASSSVPMTERLRDTLARHPVNHDKSAELAEIPVAQLEALEFEVRNILCDSF